MLGSMACRWQHRMIREGCKRRCELLCGRHGRGVRRTAFSPEPSSVPASVSSVSSVLGPFYPRLDIPGPPGTAINAFPYTVSGIKVICRGHVAQALGKGPMRGEEGRAVERLCSLLRSSQPTATTPTRLHDLVVPPISQTYRLGQPMRFPSSLLISFRFLL